MYTNVAQKTSRGCVRDDSLDPTPQTSARGNWRRTARKRHWVSAWKQKLRETGHLHFVRYTTDALRTICLTPMCSGIELQDLTGRLAMHPKNPKDSRPGSQLSLCQKRNPNTFDDRIRSKLTQMKSILIEMTDSCLCARKQHQAR